MSGSNILDTRPKGTIVAVLRPAWWTEIAAGWPVWKACASETLQRFPGWL
jgi:hypothetical protein